MTEFTMTIGGAPAPTETTFPVINPATGEPFAEAPECTRQQLDSAFEAASKAFDDWRNDKKVRREALQHAGELLAANADEIAPVLTAEQGKPLANARAEVLGASMGLTGAAALEFRREVLQDDAAARVEVVRRPLGVVAAITAWNYPVALASVKIGPALLAGNTVVLKPSPYTPLSTLLMGEVIREAFPPGVVNIVSGGDGLGAWMTSHPLARKISFTGSVATGKKVAIAAAPDLKRVTLELGGNDAAILLDDFDPATMTEKLFWGAFINSGQVCAAIKRVYVPEALYDDVVSALAERARRTTVGAGTREGVELGPLQNRMQFERVSELVADAVHTGAHAAAGGQPMEGSGYFFEPTILAGISDGTRIVDEEQFGPALPVIAYRDLDDAVARANATHFGLDGSVWSPDVERAMQVGERLDCGTTWVNAHALPIPNAPFGGHKWSGLGVEGGTWGLAAFTETHTLYTSKEFAGGVAEASTGPALA